jgi:DNA-binding MarR family transcriptional regulator
MRIPNSFVTRFTQASDLKLACVFYSLIHKNTKRNLIGYEITVKQSTLMSLCGCSLSTVKRTVRSLSKCGFIKSQKRQMTTPGKLGTYTYTIDAVSTASKYFTMDKKLMSRLNGNEFRIYAVCCKLADSSHKSFFQSYNDLSKLLGMSRQDVLRTIEKLVKGKFIRKKKIRTRVGDFTDNTYTVCIYVPHSRIKKAPRRSSRRQSIHCFTMNTPIKNTSSLYNKSSALSIGFKKKMRLLEIFFLKRGSG